MRIPIIQGVIDRRILVNFRVDPSALRRLLPDPFRPKLVKEMGLAGICLIRLRHIRPRFLPSFVGVTSENAAHRIAIEWESDGELREGVYVLRRDTSSWLNSAAGGRMFPGIHHHARFDIDEQGDQYRIVIESNDGETHVVVEARNLPTCRAIQCFLRSRKHRSSLSAARWAIHPRRKRELSTGWSCEVMAGMSSRSRSSGSSRASSRARTCFRQDR